MFGSDCWYFYCVWWGSDYWFGSVCGFLVINSLVLCYLGSAYGFGVVCGSAFITCFFICVERQ